MMKIIESPREGMQGFSRFIPTGEKVRYIDQLLRVGFDTVEVGSYVSPKIIPQMSDSLDVLKKIDLSGTTSNVMFLVVNAKGAELMAGNDRITHIAYPFSFSPTFLRLNVHTTVSQSLDTAAMVTDLSHEHGKQPVIYISMAFGNPYGDPWSLDILADWVTRLYQVGVRTIPLSNVSIETDASMIASVFETLIPMFPDVEFGLHLHTANQGWFDKVAAAYNAGCRRFDGVIDGRGGCPMAGKEMLGNLKTENLLNFASANHIHLAIDHHAMQEAHKVGREVFHSCGL